MQESDAKTFERALSRLSAGFNVPVTDARREAYWRAFRKLTVLEFAGLVDTALVESTFASMPTVGALRELHHKVQPETVSPTANNGPSIQVQLCAYAARRLSHLHQTTAYSLPWNYVYRGAECIGLVVEREDGTRLKFSVADMQGEAAA